MAELGLRIDGVNELLKVMDAIEKDMMAANGAAVVAGARVVQKEARLRAPVGEREKKTYLGTHRKPGILQKSIKIKLLKPKEPGQRVALVGPAIGKKESHDGFYGVWVEKGHKIVKKSGTYFSKWRKLNRTLIKYEYGGSDAAPHPFMRPAFDTKQEEAQQKMAEVYQQAIDRKFDKGKTIDALEDLIEN